MTIVMRPLSNAASSGCMQCMYGWYMQCMYEVIKKA